MIYVDQETGIQKPFYFYVQIRKSDALIVSRCEKYFHQFIVKVNALGMCYFSSIASSCSLNDYFFPKSEKHNVLIK